MFHTLNTMHARLCHDMLPRKTPSSELGDVNISTLNIILNFEGSFKNQLIIVKSFFSEFS